MIRTAVLVAGMAHLHHDAAVAMVVTTSTFTGPAWDLADQPRIDLVDGDPLVTMLADARALAERPTAPAPKDLSRTGTR